MNKEQIIEHIDAAISNCQSIMRRLGQPGAIDKKEIDELIGVLNHARDHVEGKQGNGKS